MPTRIRRARLLLAQRAHRVRPSGEALAHGDPTTHYLKSGSLYPSFAARPSQARELALMGLLQAAAERGYPVKVSLIGSIDDLVDAPEMFEVAAALRRIRRVRARRSQAARSGPGRQSQRLRRLGHAAAGENAATGEPRRGACLRPRDRRPAGRGRCHGRGGVTRSAAVGAIGGSALAGPCCAIALPTPAVASDSRPVPRRSNATENSAAGWALFAVLGLVFAFAALAQRVRRQRVP